MRRLRRHRASGAETYARVTPPSGTRFVERILFVALCRRYGLEPFRERGRRTSTIQVRAPKTFHHGTLWPEFLALSKELKAHLEELTERVIREAIHDDVTEAPEAGVTKALPSGTPLSDQGAGSPDGDNKESPT